MQCLSDVLSSPLNLVPLLCMAAFGAADVAQAQATFFDARSPVGDPDTRAFGVALLDADGDGDLDAYVPRADAPDELWLNDGLGITFELGGTFGDESGVMARVADLNGDDVLDIFVLNQNNQPNRVYFGDGAGGFEDSGQDIGAQASTDVAFGDVDGDDDLDAVISNTGGNNSQVWLNDGGGVFTDTEQGLCTGSSGAVGLGDLDDDGDLDIYCANNGLVRDEVFQADSVLFNDGLGVFTDSGQVLDDFNSTDLAVLDVDGDGDLDVLVSHYNTSPALARLNDGDGVFTESVALGMGPAKGLALADFNGDDIPDVYFTHENTPDTLWFGDGAGGYTLSAQESIGGNSTTQYSALGDLNGDGDIDVFQVRFRDTSRVLLNTPDTDEDTVGDEVDNCPEDANEDQADADGNGVGDLCEPMPEPEPEPAPEPEPEPITVAGDNAEDGGCDCAQLSQKKPGSHLGWLLFVLGAVFLVRRSTTLTGAAG